MKLLRVVLLQSLTGVKGFHEFLTVLPNTKPTTTYEVDRTLQFEEQCYYLNLAKPRSRVSVRSFLLRISHRLLNSFLTTIWGVADECLGEKDGGYMESQGHRHLSLNPFQYYYQDRFSR